MGLTAEEELKKYINHLISEKELNCPTCNSNTFYGALVIDTRNFNFKINNEKIEKFNLFPLYENNSYIQIKCSNDKCEQLIVMDSYE